jgi:SulP family sulfate permease
VVLHRMAQTAGIQSGTPFVAADRSDTAEPRAPYDAETVSHSNVIVYRLTGAFFFGTASMVSAVLDRIGDQHKAFVLDLAAVPFVDSTAGNVIASLARRTARHKVKLYLTGASPAVRRALLIAGVRPPLATYRKSIDNALQEAQGHVVSAA